jgi:hypothetical protein
VQNGRSLNSDHRRHDRLLIARFAAGDAYPGERDEARELVETCSDCEALAADIRSLSSAMSRLPDAKRARDFRLTPEQAERLHGNWFERFMRTLAAPGLGMLRPVAGVAMSIGLALVIIGNLPLGAPMAAAPEEVDMFSSQAPALAATNAPAATDASAPEGTPADGPVVGAPGEEPEPAMNPETYPTSTSRPSNRADVPQPGEVQASPQPDNDDLNKAYLSMDETSGGEDGADDESAVANSPRSGDMLIMSGIFLAIAGLSLLAVIWFARRRFRDPLLR